ncbi:hypothetical protein [Yersinia aleksiciae]|uniref:hypothetical protein n=1 Tax=Yersinia aleksiciae TaxID=263819 RepID=UPI000B6F7DDE|nr:hypothetical protein [Yersinia aleksiciae]OWF83708.1 hypothetical protein B4903_00955 [Yersinia frederiksenii]
MSIFLTVTSGVLIYVFGQLILKLLIEPVHDFKKSISKISYDLIFHANVLANPRPYEDEKMQFVCKLMREHSSILHANMYLIPCYKYTSNFFGLPKEECVIEATKGLIFLSNGHDGALANQGILNTYKIQSIKKNLNIKTPKGDYLDPALEKDFVKAKEN